jgi:hypothetical protein
VFQGGDPVADVLLQGLDGPVDAAPYLLVGQFGEPSIDEVQPGRAGRCEVRMEPGISLAQSASRIDGGHLA